jgi:hypothetical protein
MKRKASSTPTPKKTKKTKKIKLTKTGKGAAKAAAKAAIGKRRSTRVSSRHVTTVKPVLTFTSSYSRTAVTTQKETPEQNMFFVQTATLAIDTDAPVDIAHYYEFRQQVKDSDTYESGATHALGPFEQDDNYEPPYDSEQTLSVKKQIQFTDEPGFSTTAKVAANEWLTSYDVYFRWTVQALYGTRDTWTSPEVHHSLASPYNGGLDGPVTATPAGDYEWTVNLPDRPAG